MRSLEQADMFSPSNPEAPLAKGNKQSHQSKESKTAVPKSSEAQAPKTAVKGLSELYGNLHGDMTFAKRDFAYGNLRAKVLDGISKYFVVSCYLS